MLVITIEQVLEIGSRELSILVNVDQLEGPSDFSLVDKSTSVNTNRYEVLEVNDTVVVQITNAKDLEPFQVRHVLVLLRELQQQLLLQILQLQRPSLIPIKPQELLLQLLQLLLGCTQPSHQRQHQLLKFVEFAETNDIFMN